MRALLPLTILLASAPATTKREAPPSALAQACRPVAPAADRACGADPLCSAQSRVALACELGRAIEDRYVFYPTKRASGGRPLDAHLAACADAERAIEREDDPLRFYDRLRACAGALEDGHVVLGVPDGLPTVALGVGLRRAGGRVVVAGREERLLAHLEEAPGGAGVREALAPGNEVIEVDGRPVREALDALARLVPGSSLAARLERAVDALTRRDFRFPEARHATLTTVDARGRVRDVRLPWWLSPSAAESALGRAYAARTGLETTDLVPWGHVRDPSVAAAADRAGTLRTDPILPPERAAALRTLLDERDRVAVRLGEAARPGGRPFCYLQVLTFHTDTLAEGGARRPFADPIEGFVKACGARKLDVVLDLRTNGGGYLANASALVAALLPRGATAAGGALLVRDTDQARAVYEERARRGRWPSDGPDPSRVLRALGRARREGADFTPAFFESPVRSSARAGGYDGRVVALVSPACMSACDRAAAMLRGSGRAVLIGEPTEGAGGSQQEVPGAISTVWLDGARRVSLAIPNAAMGVPRSAAAVGAEADAATFLSALALENRPVEPDVAYAPALEDVTHHGRGWLAAVEAALFPAEAAPVAAAPPPGAPRERAGAAASAAAGAGGTSPATP